VRYGVGSIVYFNRSAFCACRGLGRARSCTGWTGLLGYPLVPEPFINVGHKLETAIYLHWRRQREDLGYLGGEREIDLVVNPEQPELLVNVAAHIDRPQVCCSPRTGF
jgi:predicted AAA+ superfamily ATPase